AAELGLSPFKREVTGSNPVPPPQNSQSSLRTFAPTFVITKCSEAPPLRLKTPCSMKQINTGQIETKISENKSPIFDSKL
ncbi:MAG TPA: hypothetical protein DEG17_06490, partial [Cyanobacteria bacterium UBA11149]|nr:hypothetical protein [Cyanobacteria bacterium UBA11149]